MCSVYLHSTGKEGEAKNYYTLESILYLLKNKHINHTSYVKKALVSLWKVFSQFCV